MPHDMHEHSRFERCRCAAVPADPSQGPRPFRLPGDPERFGRARPYDIHHLQLEGRLDIPRRAFTATARLTVSQRDPDVHTLKLDAIGFDVAGVLRSEGERVTPLAHRYDGDCIHVDLGALAPGEHATVVVTYTVVEPRRGLYFIHPDEQRPHRGLQVWSQCQDEDAKFWIPCHDFPNVRMSTEFLITAPHGWTVISNGVLLERSAITHEGDSQHGVHPPEERWHWRQDAPHVAYLMTLVAGRFSELNADMPALPVRYYVDPGREDDGWRTFRRTPEMIEHFARLTGVPYPWAKYYQAAVQDFTFGGMENTSATTMADRILVDERASLDFTADDIVAHELAHQWFGDLVTCRDWSHAWLNEGFATFFEHLDWEKKGGRDAYLYNLKEHGDSYFGEDEGKYRRPVVCNTYASPIDLFDRHLYEKGGWVLHMLRSELGDALFFGGVKRYVEKHRGGIVETRDLMRAMEDESGRSLEHFFEQWLTRAGFPEIEFEASHDADKAELTVSVKQTQTVDAVTPLFALRIAVDVVVGSHSERHVLAIREAARTFTIVCKAAPRRISVDPEGAILMRLTQKLPRDWLLDALAHDPHAVVRWRAANALVRRSEPKVVDALAAAVEDDGFWGVGAEAARALGEMKTDRAFRALERLAGVKHPKVRRAVVRAIGTFRTPAAAGLLAARLDAGDPSVGVESELARSAGRTRQPQVFDALSRAIERGTWRDLVRIGAIDGLAALRDARAIPLVDRYADVAHYVGTRRAAVGALAELGENKRDVRERLEQLLDPDDPYFTPEVLRSLVKLKEPASLGAVNSLLRRTIDGRVKRNAREAIRDLRGAERPEEVKRLSDALDKLKDEQQSLADRFARWTDAATAKADAAPKAKSGGTSPALRKRGNVKAAKKDRSSPQARRRS